MLINNKLCAFDTYKTLILFYYILLQFVIFFKIKSNVELKEQIKKTIFYYDLTVVWIQLM